MKTFFKSLLLTLLVLNCSYAMSTPPEILNLNDGWTFRQMRLSNIYPATVPGCVHLDLIKNGIIADPYIGLNERAVQWVDKEDWEYSTEFFVDADFIKKDNIELCFEGLDTYAEVKLNGKTILKADNMFLEWNVDVKPFVVAGKNVLTVQFTSPLKVDLPKFDALDFQYFCDNDQSQNGGMFDKRVSIFCRKAGYHYGWDWGPRLVTCGIWRPVYIRTWNDARIDDVFYNVLSVSKKSAVVDIEISVDATKQMNNVVLKLVDVSVKPRIIKTMTQNLKQGKNVFHWKYEIKNPRLWWTNGLGKQDMYTFSVQMSRNEDVLDVKDERIGIRKVELIHEKDKYGTSFYFKLNGVPVFMKGANYIPDEMFLTRLNEDSYRKCITDAVDVHMNMLRVWGGGIYEDENFYKLCDEYGLLVWQDFMFACSIYPFEGDFRNNVIKEAVYNVKRLRNHPCIAVWCGNNECNDAWYGWGYQPRYSSESKKIITSQLNDQFFNALDSVVKIYAPGMSYTPTSPYVSIDGVRSDEANHDRHYWTVWQQILPISTYNTEKGRFFSEYGFQSFPEYSTVLTYINKPTDEDIHSEVMMWHQRGGKTANSRIEAYLKQEYREPKSFTELLYMGQVLQSDIIKLAVESHRRQMPYCMGSLYWQLNDCWPVASWSSRDYYKKWKAQHYMLRSAFNDVLVSPVVENDSLKIYVVSDRLNACKGNLKTSCKTLDGRVVWSCSKTVNVAGNASNCCLSISKSDVLNGEKSSDVFVSVDLEISGDIYSNNLFMVDYQKEMNFTKPSIHHNVELIDGGYKVNLTTEKYARAVCLSCKDCYSTYSDNYFDIRPGEEKSVVVRTLLNADDFEKSLSVRSLILRD